MLGDALRAFFNSLHAGKIFHAVLLFEYFFIDKHFQKILSVSLLYPILYTF